MLASISAGLSLASGLKGLFGKSGSQSRKFWEQMRYNHSVNTNQIQWRVADAKKAGIHPLYALGQAPMSGASIQIPGQSNYGDSASDSFRHAVKDLQERRQSKMDREWMEYERANKQQRDSLDTLIQMQQLENMKRENDFVSEQISASQAKRFSQSTKSRIDKYIQIYNPFNGKTEWMVNPELGVEYPETYGAALLMRATGKDLEGPQKRIVDKVNRLNRKYSEGR